MKRTDLRKTLSTAALMGGMIVTAGALAQSQGGNAGHGMMRGNGTGMMGGYGSNWMGGWMGGGYGGTWLLVLLVMVVAGLVAWIVAQKRK